METAAALLDDTAFRAFAAIAHREAGISLGPSKRSLVQNRLS